MTSQNHNIMQQQQVLLPTLLIIGVVSALLAYVGLPAIGVEVFKYQLGIKKLLTFAALPMLFIIYIGYWQAVQKQPIILIVLMAVFWSVVAFFNEKLLLTGVNIHLRALLIPGLVLPAGWILLKNAGLLLKKIPAITWYGLFFIWLSVYFFFNNASQVADGFGLSMQSTASIGLIQYESYLYSLLAIAVTGVTFLKAKEPQHLFDQLNMIYLPVSICIALYTIVGYPAGLTSLELDGFRRAFGIFSHPNPYAHSMGVQMIYLMGLMSYYAQRQVPKPLLKPLLWFALAINGVAFLLGLSKTAIAFVSLAAVIFAMLGLLSGFLNRSVWKLVLLACILLPLALSVYSLVTGNSFMSVLESRMEETTSMVWRNQVWEYILDNLTFSQLLTGHGFTSSNMLIYQMTYHNVLNAKPLIMVHNGYLAILYDLGVLGLTLFCAVFVMIVHALSSLKYLSESSKTLLTTVIALSVYFLSVCGFDEMTYMFNAPLLFWIFSVTCFSVALTAQEGKCHE